MEEDYEGRISKFEKEIDLLKAKVKPNKVFSDPFANLKPIEIEDDDLPF